MADAGHLRNRFPPLACTLLLTCAVGAAQTILEFPIPAPSHPIDVTAGPDGNVWFADIASPTTIGKLSTSGAVTRFPTELAADILPISVTAGPDGNVWIAATEPGGESEILSITPSGVFSAGFRLQDLSAGVIDIVAGPDGNLWFTQGLVDKIGRITPGGDMTEFPTPTTSSGPYSIALGPDGALWFTENRVSQIGRITTAGVITEFHSPRAPSAITAGPDGNLWYVETAANRIGRITPAGVITSFEVPTASSRPTGIAPGPDGNVWFTESAANKIGRITPAGVITEFPVPTPNASPNGIALGPDGNLWFTEFAVGRIGRVRFEEPIDRRVLPVVGSTPGAGGTFFRTSVQLHNAGTTPASGRIVFHPSGASGSDSDVALSYSLGPGATESVADLLPAMNQSGLGSADILVTSGSTPTVTARVFNDAGAAGTTGFTEAAMRVEESIGAGQHGVLLVPADLTNFRMNIGVRAVDATLMTLTVRDAGGTVAAVIPKFYPATYHEQQSATAFLNGLALPPGGSITVLVDAGRAIVYGATVDNRTGDPSMQIATVR